MDRLKAIEAILMLDAIGRRLPTARFPAVLIEDSAINQLIKERGGSALAEAIHAIYSLALAEVQEAPPTQST